MTRHPDRRDFLKNASVLAFIARTILMSVLLLCLACVEQSRGQPTLPRGTVQVTMEDGKKVSGILQLAVVKMKTDLGILEMDVAKLRSITFGKDADTVVAATGTVQGKVITDEFKLRTELGLLTLARDKMQTLTFADAAGSAAKPIPADDKTPKRDIPADNELKPTATVKLDAAVPNMIFAKDRRAIYLLNQGQLKLQCLDTTRRALEPESAELTRGTEGMCISPDGKTICTYASPEGHKYYDKKPEVGKIQVIDAESMKLKSTFAIAFDPCGIAVNDAGQMFLTNGSNQWTNIAIVDIKAQAITKQLTGVRHQSILRMSPDQRRLYWAETDVSPANINCAILPTPPAKAEPGEIEKLIKELGSPRFTEREAATKRLEEIGEAALFPLKKAAESDDVELRRRAQDLVVLAEKRLEGRPEVYRSPYHGTYPLGGRFEVAPDGKHIIFGTGTVLQAGREKGEDLKYVTKVEPHIASAMDGDVLLVATAKQTLTVYSYPEFKVQKAYLLAAPVYQMLFDAAKGTVYCAADTQGKGDGRLKAGIGDLHIYELKELVRPAKGKP